MRFLRENTPSSFKGRRKSLIGGWGDLSPLRVLQTTGGQIFLVFPLDFRSTYGPDSSHDPKFVTSLSSALINL